MKLASESHVPRFRAGVGTWRSGYMIPIRLPWRHRARPSATLHEIPVCPERQTCLHDATHLKVLRQELFLYSCTLVPLLYRLYRLYRSMFRFWPEIKNAASQPIAANTCRTRAWTGSRGREIKS
jgi:hypothetical protein